jgi:dTDP-4-amino-4,6-dideoxygalactose transaminase
MTTDHTTTGPQAAERMKIPFARVACDGNELKYVREVLESGWLTTAGRTFEFEKRFAEMLGARHACAVNSCTAALHLALEAIGVGPGDKVLVPTLTFTATAEIVRYLDADPVFADVEYGTALLTPNIVERSLQREPKIKAVVVVHFGGQAAQMTSQPSPLDPRLSTLDPPEWRQGILEVCRRYAVKVIEDAAHAFPTRLGPRMVGCFGDATCFSFYANKTITTGEGGMLVTNDDAIYARARVMRLHGINRDIWDRFTGEGPSWEYDVVAPGFKYNMPDVNAAIGLAQLERAEAMRQERQRCFEYYLEHLAGIDCLDLPVIRGALEDHSCHLFRIVLNEHAPVSRNRLIELLGEAGIGTSVHYKPLHRMTYYRQRYGLKTEDFPNAEKHWRGCVSLPVYPTLSNDELAYIVSQIKRILRVSGSKVSEPRLAGRAAH